mgnify:CR=1 FL=1
MFSFFKKKKASGEDAGTAGTEQAAAESAGAGGDAESQAGQGSGSAAPGAGSATSQAPVDIGAVGQPAEAAARASEPAAQKAPAASDEPASSTASDAPGVRSGVTADPVEEAVPLSASEPAGAVPESVPTAQPAPETAPAAESPAPQAPAPAPSRGSWLSRLKQGLSRTGQSIGGLFMGVKVDDALFDELETALIMADAGVEATEKLLAALRAKVRKERLEDAAQVKAALRDILTEHLAPLEKKFPVGYASPIVVMIAGVNGAGKTTSIGKLAYAFQGQGEKVLLAAGDTFRAAAREQLIVWGERNNVSVIAQDGGDPAAVAFDAVNAGRARGATIVMVDTAGRLPTQLHLMEELKKIRRVISKADSQAPHEVLLVVDGNTGQNAIAQIRAFDAAIQLTGLVVTKLDGTAKGGTLAAVAAGSQGVRPIPVYWIGVGEGMEDLQPFVAREFASAMVGD